VLGASPVPTTVFVCSFRELQGQRVELGPRAPKHLGPQNTQLSFSLRGKHVGGLSAPEQRVPCPCLSAWTS
jgi:hypothetical protein